MLLPHAVILEWYNLTFDKLQKRAENQNLFSLVQVNLHSIRFSSVFVRSFTFLLLLDKVCAFYPHFYVSISALTRQSHTGQKFSEKNFLLRGTALFQNIALIVHTQNF